VSDVAIDAQEEFRRREFRRFLIGSLILHVGVFLVLVIDPGGEVAIPRGVVSVDLVSLPTPPAPKPAPKKVAPEPAAKPVPPPPPKAPVQEKIVLPKESRLPPPKPKEEKVAPKPAPEPVRKELTPEDLARPQEQEYDDIMAQLRAESDEIFPESEPVEEAPPAPKPAGVPTGTARSISPEESVWMRKAKIHVRQAWTLTPGFRTQMLETHVSVDLDSGGAVVGEPTIVRRSGNPWYDDSVVRALEKASPLPPPPAAGEWSFVFVPDDSF
jgi:TonB family protein